MLVEPGKKLTRFQDVMLWFAVVKDVAAAGTAVYLIIRFAIRVGPRLFALSSRWLGTHGTQAGVGAVVVGMGLGAYWFKSKRQRWYGTVEIAFGAVGGFFICFTLEQGKTLLSQWVGLVGCAYVIARGLNNVAEASAKARVRVLAPNVASNPSTNP
jgi:hypothetical protein